MPRRDPVDRLDEEILAPLPYDPIFNRLHQATPKPAIPHHTNHENEEAFKSATSDVR